MRRPTIWIKYCFPLAVLALTACTKQAPVQAAPPPMPVQTATVAASPVPQYDEYVSTIKGRRSATIQPQVDGNLTKIYVHSGDRVHAGQILMEIDPAKQEATVASTKATEQQKLAVFQYNQIEVERQRKLFEQGVTSRDALDQAEQSYKNSQADYESTTAATQSQRKQLGYYHIAAPFDGIVGDVPVHLGDYVSASTVLTTVDENRDLEVYVYIPAEKVTQIRKGLPIVVVDNQENVLEHTAIDFISPQVDNGLQGILVKAPVHADLGKLRNLQQIKARVIWTTSSIPVVPVLAVTRLGGQTFVFVATNQGGKYFAKQRPITVGDTVGNDYAVLSGLQNGDKVIVSGTQFLMDGAPVQPLG
ncbi:MAG TPA: efflux RND transporter periplasmic adaptor subunit [Acidobacteriaceae bacterium]|nr:efflux RND transporter periplasmic adaptor subunit [Acidobacteriaceae bacterium]